MMSCVLGCVCPAVLNPVCGTNNQTISNACFAECARTEVQCEGECPCPDCICPAVYQPVCGTDGETILTRSDFDDSKKDKKPKRKEGVKVRLLRWSSHTTTTTMFKVNHQIINDRLYRCTVFFLFYWVYRIKVNPPSLLILRNKIRKIFKQILKWFRPCHSCNFD